MARATAIMATAVPNHRPAAIAIGEVLDGKYQILGELGRGAMGVVYEAVHLALERRVAVKTLLEEVSADPQVGARFEREARAASGIGHPHIVDVFDLGRTRDGLWFMVMELLDGESLGSMLKRTPKLPIPLAIHLMSQVLSGLGAAHKHGIVHRDLKPDNIFVLAGEERPNFVKIVDFGISKVIAPPGPGHANVTAKVAGTMVGSVLGTPLYMSPEQAIGQVAAIDHRTDIYSAGVVLYEMLCGRTPYLGESYVQIFASLLEGHYPSPRSLAPEIPPELEAAIVRALERDMDKRFASASEMRQAIGASADLTPVPVVLAQPLPVSIGEPLHTPAPQAPSTAQGSIALASMPAAPKPGPAPHDPFAPPPEADVPPIVPDDLDRPVALRPPVRAQEDGRPAELAKPARPADLEAVRGAKHPAPGTLAPERVLSPRTRSRLLLLAGVMGVALAARVAYSVFRPDGQGSLSLRRTESQQVTLDVLPKDATVQLDHNPIAERKLALEAGTHHVLNVAAPGRLTRRLSFAAEPGRRLAVHLVHTLPLPAPTDPPPLAAELLAEPAENPHGADEIEAAFAKLDRYAECLTSWSDVTVGAKKGSARLRMGTEEYGLCQRLTAEAAAAAPAMPELQAAAEAYLAAVHAGQRTEQVTRLGTTFRAEFLVARTLWQMEELALQRDRPSDWHARRVALAAQTWLRTLKAGEGTAQAAAKLQECQRAFLDQAAAVKTAEGGSGPDFVQAAADVVALAGKKPTEIVAMDGVRRLLSAFNALILP